MKQRSKFMISFGIFGLIWFAAWSVARSFVVRFAENEDRHPNWQCAQVAHGGFPLQIILSCARPRLEFDTDSEFSALAARANWAVYAPDQMQFELDGPLQKTHIAFENFSLGWQAFKGKLSGILTAQLTLQAQITQLDAGMTHAEQHYVVTADKVVFAARPLHYPVEKQSVPVDFALYGAKNAQFMQFLGINAPADLILAGDIDQFNAFAGADMATKLESWRRAGGHVVLRKLNLISGGFNFEAEGTVNLDDQHRVAGQFNVKIQGAEPLLAQLGFSPKAGLMGGLVSGLIGKGGQPLSLPLRLANGRAYFGPIALPTKLQAVY